MSKKDFKNKIERLLEERLQNLLSSKLRNNDFVKSEELEDCKIVTIPLYELLNDKELLTKYLIIIQEAYTEQELSNTDVINMFDNLIIQFEHCENYEFCKLILDTKNKFNEINKLNEHSI